MDCSTPVFPVLHYLPEFAQTYVHWVDDAIQSAHPLSPTSPPAFNLSSIKIFSNESILHIRCPMYWSFSFSISVSNEYSGLISFRIDLLTVQGTLKSLLQNHSSTASILWHSAFFMVQLSHPFMTARMWSTGEDNGKPLQYSCLENPMNCTKRWKKKTLLALITI